MSNGFEMKIPALNINAGIQYNPINHYDLYYFTKKLPVPILKPSEYNSTEYVPDLRA